MLAGNGGSAADAQHIAAEFLSRYTMDRKPLPAIALTTDTSVLTAVGNDYGFERVFERQVRGLGSAATCSSPFQRRDSRRIFWRRSRLPASLASRRSDSPEQDLTDDCAVRSCR